MQDNTNLHELAEFYKIFGDSNRLKILMLLLEGELCVNELSEILKLSHSAVSHQLRILRQTRLVKYRKDGKKSIYSLDDEHVALILKMGLNHINH